MFYIPNCRCYILFIVSNEKSFMGKLLIIPDILTPNCYEIYFFKNKNSFFCRQNTDLFYF